MSDLALTANRKEKFATAIGFLSILAFFILIQSFLPMRTAVQIGADEGFELAKATLCLQGHHLYAEVWNDQPPLHTWIVTEVLKHVSMSVLWARLVTSGFTVILLASIFLLVRRLNGVFAAYITAILLIMSPGFLELSASCMLEVPGLATIIAGLCILVHLPNKKSLVGEIASGILFGMALQIKLIGLVWVPLIGLLICYQLMPKNQMDGFWQQGLNVLRSRNYACRVMVFGLVMIAAWVAVDLLVDHGAYIANFQQPWQSHFGGTKTTDYGTPAEHAFQWIVFLRNWDMTVPALLGIVWAIKRFRTIFTLFPVIWFGWALLVFTVHKPWWPYYYIHLAVPLCWLAGLGIVWTLKVFSFPNSWLQKALITGIVLFICASLTWMGMRVCLEVTSMRAQPRIFSSLVIPEAERYKQYTHWLYADDTILSFYTGMPLPPTLAVMPVKRFWAGDMTNERLVSELTKFKPEVFILNNKDTWVPYRDLLDQNYRMVYQDNTYQLYVLKPIIKLVGH